MDNFYVYAYLRDDGTPYYIGKGKNKRAWAKHSYVNRPKDKSKIVIVENNLTELWAFARERYYIRWYGRKDLGTGILRNMTEGGDGTSGFRFTEEQKAKRRGENSPLWGKTFSDEHIEKLKEAKLGTKLSLETRKKMSEVKKGKITGENNPVHKPGVKEKIATKKRGVKQSSEWISKRAEKMKGEDNPSKKYRMNCIHCGTECCLGTLKRWHNDNCKHK